MAILTVGIDLAKNVFALHGLNEASRPELLRTSVPRAKLDALVAGLPSCTIGIDACSSVHYWARQFAQHGHGATAFVTMEGNGREFKSSQQFAAWLALLPGQYSYSGKTRLGRITKADSLSRWARALEERRSYWKAVVAIAAKTARMAWVRLTKRDAFRLPA